MFVPKVQTFSNLALKILMWKLKLQITCSNISVYHEKTGEQLKNEVVTIEKNKVNNQLRRG